jgi:hypothetical protein
MRDWLRKSYLGAALSVCFVLLGLPAAGQGDFSLYDQKKGFAPAQRSLTTTFLKLAASLEATGDPWVYAEWVLKENDRIDRKYRKAFGGNSTSRPGYLDAEYCDQLIGQWRKLERPLKLKSLSQEAGRLMRYAILGSWHRTPAEIAADEVTLSDAERSQFMGFLKNDFLKRGDLPEMEAFYMEGAGYDKLSAAGKGEMAVRLWLGTLPAKPRQKELDRFRGGTVIVEVLNEYQQLLIADMKTPGKRTTGFKTLQGMLEKRLRLNEMMPDIGKLAWNEKDAIRHSHGIVELFHSRFRLFEGKIDKESEEILKNQMRSMVENLLVFAHLEFMAGLTEKMADDQLAKQR